MFSVPAKLRRTLRNVLISEVLPFIKKIGDGPGKLNLEVYYRTFSKSNWEPLDRGGLYIEKRWKSDKLIPESQLLYRNKEFDIDEQIKEILK